MIFFNITQLFPLTEKEGFIKTEGWITVKKNYPSFQMEFHHKGALSIMLCEYHGFLNTVNKGQYEMTSLTKIKLTTESDE